jgi:hypothetical protein
MEQVQIFLSAFKTSLAWPLLEGGREHPITPVKSKPVHKTGINPMMMRESLFMSRL